MTKKQTQTRAILFADIKGYSENREDSNILGKIHDLLYDEIGGKFFEDRTTTMFKVIGDGLLATCPTAQEMAGKALEILDIFENNHFEKEHNLSNDLQIRIALHFGEITEDMQENGQIRDVFGANVILTARIEPIVKANYIFCTKEFNKETLSGKEGTAFIQKITVGKATDQTEVSLYALFPKAQQDNFEDVEPLKQHIKDKQTDLNSVKVQFFEAFLNNDTQAIQKLIAEYPQELAKYQSILEHIKEKEAQTPNTVITQSQNNGVQVGVQNAKNVTNIQGDVGTLHIN